MGRVRMAVVLIVVMATVVSAQRFGGRGFACRSSWDADNYFVSPYFGGNPTYDGRVTFARILRDISTVNAFVEDGPITGSTVLRLDEPALSYYPIAYLSEPEAGS